MTYQEATKQFERLSLAERIQLIEFLGRSVREEVAKIEQTAPESSNGKSKHDLAALAGIVSGSNRTDVPAVYKPFHVRTFSLGGHVEFDRDELYLERGF